MADSRITAVLGPTNTGKTHLAVDRLCAHASGMMGFPLRLLAREIYDRVVAIKGPKQVGLLTGEERIMPRDARWLLCTTESMPIERDVAFVAIDEVQLASDAERGHVFTDRMLNVRGREETMLLGSASMTTVIRSVIPEAEIVTRPRFSKLSYAPPKKLAKLPARSAIVAFSVEEVYAIAESLRRARGGAAVVTGALSPQTRNAQVKLYQDGDVDYLVATDAIGMGLNMDVAHVYFASLAKFDGRRSRRLTLPEMAQIAGRAGRYQRDGAFSTIAGADYFSDSEIERIEEHRFTQLDHVYWREAEPDMTSIESLIASLERLPAHPRLRAAPEALDVQTLRWLSADDSVTRLAHGAGRVARLWDACRLPDFQKLGPEFHARMVARLFVHLGQGDQVLPDAMIADQLARLDCVQGDVTTIAARIATARTWSYVAQRADWLRDPAKWRTRASELESKLSDALHARLTERFVDRRTKMLMHYTASRGVADKVEISASGAVHVDDQPIGTLVGFRFAPDPDAALIDRKRLLAAAEKHLAREIANRAAQLAGCADRDLALAMVTDQPVCIVWRSHEIARLTPGKSLTKPGISFDASLRALDPRSFAMIDARVKAWLTARIDHTLSAVVRIEALTYRDTTSPILRGLLAQLVANGGILDRQDGETAIAQLTAAQRSLVRKTGIVIGALDIFHPALIKPEAAKLRLALTMVQSGRPMAPVPMPGIGLIDHPSDALGRAAMICGYRRFGAQMVRIDLVERIARHVHDQRSGRLPFSPDRALATAIGVGEQTLSAVLRALGFVAIAQADGAMWAWRGRKRAPLPVSPSRGHAAFAALGALATRDHR